MKLDYFLIQLIEYALEHKLIDQKGIEQAKNNLSKIFFNYEFNYIKSDLELTYEEMIEPLLNLAYSKALFEPNSISERDAFEAKIMDAVMPSPQKVKREFLNVEDLSSAIYFLIYTVFLTQYY